MKTSMKTISLMAASVLTLGACVTTDGANNALATAAAIQQVRGGPGAPGTAGALNAVGAVQGGAANASVAAMQSAPNDPRSIRAEEALKQLYLPSASCKDMQDKQQATINSIAELDPLVGNLMFKQQHERLKIQRDSLNNIAKSKKCKLPTKVALTGEAARYAKMSCTQMKAEYTKVQGSGNKVADTANQVGQVANMASQFGGLIPGMGGANAQMLAAQANQMANTANVATANPAEEQKRAATRMDIEAAASTKNCSLQ